MRNQEAARRRRYKKPRVRGPIKPQRSTPPEKAWLIRMTTPFLSIVVSHGKDDSTELLIRTLQAFQAQEGLGKCFNMNLNVWCDSSSGVGEALSQFDPSASVFESPIPFLATLPQSLTRLDQQNLTHVVLVRCGVLPKPSCLSFLVGKIAEYGEDMALLTARGYRLFPHEKLSSPLTELKEGVHYKFYDPSYIERALHVFTCDFCCIGLPLLRDIGKHSKEVDVSGFDHLWCSFVTGCHLKLLIWKLCMEHHLDFSQVQPLCTTLLCGAENPASFEKFYRLSYDSNWPIGVSEVYQCREKLEAAMSSHESCKDIWKRGFAGVNMLSEPASHLDLPAAASCGVRVIRIGAVGGAQDLAYLLDTASSSPAEDKAHLLKVLPRLRKSLIEIGKYGMKCIITLVDLPGSPFFSLADNVTMSFWDSKELRLRATKFWALLAEYLIDLRHLIMGYDLINEPYTPEDREVGYFDENPMTRMETLNNFYRETVNEIRLHDKETVIILKCTWFAMPFTMGILQPLPDPNIKYGFHCYLPPHLTIHRDKHYPDRKYPWVFKLPNRTNPETVVIDKSYLRQLLRDHVVSWQTQHAIPSSQMLVAEFGICREVPGAQNYLSDLVELFSAFGWSWLLFSYRDEEWDAMDYELGSHKTNMLYRSPTDMFLSVARHFR